jgi:putative transposase
MVSPPALQYGVYYHIYNRGVNQENIFREERNYTYFLKLYAHYIGPVADTYAYCLLRNHFHLLVRIHDEEEIEAQTLKVSETFRVLNPSRQFSNLFNAYAKAINKAYDRTGSLFQHPFGRVAVTDDSYFLNLVAYIHHNPQKHGFVNDFREWRYSSYQAHLSDQTTRLKRAQVLDWFQGQEAFVAFHQIDVDARSIAPLIPDDFD